MPEPVIVYPKPGVTLYLPGQVHGFTAEMGRPVPLHPDHAEALSRSGHVETVSDRAANEVMAAAQSRRAQRAPESSETPAI